MRCEGRMEESTKTWLERLETKIDKITIILNGNGKLGLVAKVQVLWEVNRRRNGFVDWFFRIIVLGLLTYLGITK